MMKYDEEDLAQAAILLGLERQSARMPAALEAKILAKGRAVAVESRFTTTKAAALAVEPTSEGRAAARKPNVAAWIGWAAAAACFAFGVYQWRLSTLPRAPAASEPAASLAVVLTDDAGAAIGELVRVDDHGELTVTLPESVAGEQYTLWLSNDAAAARPVGAFRCTNACVRYRFGIRKEDMPARVSHAWLTHDGVDQPRTQVEPSRVVGRSAK